MPASPRHRGGMLRSPLPLDLGDSFSTAAALAAGVSRSRLRSKDLLRPFHGVRTRSACDVEPERSVERELLDRMCRYAPRMPAGQFFTLVSAAVAWSIPLPLSLVMGRALDVGVFAPRRGPAGRGVIGHAVKPELAHTVIHPELGLRVTTPASTWAMLGSVLTRLEDVVAAADAAQRIPMHPDDPPALATRPQLEAALTAGRRRGAALLREALPRAITRSRSRPESWMRIVLVDAGLPEPFANFDVFDGGSWLAQVDLAYPERKVAMEYEGDHHRTDARQWTIDIQRVDRLAEAGWRVIRVTRQDIYVHPAQFAVRVRRALDGARR